MPRPPIWYLLLVISTLTTTTTTAEQHRRRTKIMDLAQVHVLPPKPPQPSVQSASSSSSRQLDPDDGGEDLPEGWICMKKVVMEEETAWDYEEKCHHVTAQNCYQAFKTEFVPQKVEECDEKFRKDCFITYTNVVTSRNVEVCDEEIRRDCDATDGAVVCSTQYETVCETTYAEYDVEEDVPACEYVKEERCKNHPDTGEQTDDCVSIPKRVCTQSKETNKKAIPHMGCSARPKRVCGPETCPIVKGDRKCREEVRHLVQEVPEEECNLIPQRSCREEVQIVPNLVPEEKCVDVPKEVCVMTRVNPTKVQRPVVKRWCGPDPAANEGQSSSDVTRGNTLAQDTNQKKRKL